MSRPRSILALAAAPALAACLPLLLGALPAAAQTGSAEPPLSPRGPWTGELAGEDIRPADETPRPLEQVAFEQRLGEPVPTDLEFLDEAGRRVTLADYLDERPVLLAPVYFDCPLLCPMALSGLAASLKALTFDVGEDFDVVAFSFAPDEGPELAAEAERRTVHHYGRAGSETGFHFLTAAPDAPEAPRRLAESIGFDYELDPESGEYAHASGIVLLTPDARVSRYFYGIEYPPKDLRLGLIEASEDRIGTVVDQLILYCFHYDPAIGRYSAVAVNVLRAAAALTVVTLAGFVLLMLWRERRRPRLSTRRA